MSSAATMPISSPLPRIGAAAVSGSSPPSSTWMPGVPGGGDGSSSGARFSIRSGSVTGTSYSTVSRAVSRSVAEPRRRHRDGVVHRGRAASASGPVTSAPTGGAVAGRARRPGRWRCRRPGVCSRSWSMPTWARAPGMSQLSWGVPPNAAGEGEDGDRDHQPGGDRPPGVGRGGAAETVEEAGHDGAPVLVVEEGWWREGQARWRRARASSRSNRRRFARQSSRIGSPASVASSPA